MKVSACLITRNEEKNLLRCLGSLPRNIDELVIVDGLSRDRTAAIAKRFKARVVQRKFSGSYSDERNFCISLARNNWILTLDADEVLDTGLREELEKIITGNEPNDAMFCCPRKTIRAGEFIFAYYSYPNFKPVLFDRRKCRYVGAVHEILTFDGKRKFVPHHLMHYKERAKNTGPMQVRYNRLAQKTTYALDHPFQRRLSNVWFTTHSMLFGLGFWKSLRGWRYTTGYLLYLYKKSQKS